MRACHSLPATEPKRTSREIDQRDDVNSPPIGGVNSGLRVGMSPAAVAQRIRLIALSLGKFQC
jgi:hypothetical protein